MEVDSFKVASILHDVEDDLVVITVKKGEPTVLGIPQSEVVKMIKKMVEDDIITISPCWGSRWYDLFEPARRRG